MVFDPLKTRKQMVREEERKKALQLRLAGATYAEIGEAMGCGISAARTRIKGALSDICAEERGQLRSIEVARLDRLQRSCWAAALAGDLAAIDRSVKIIDRRAKLLGLDAPQQMEVTSSMDVDLDGTAAKIMELAKAQALQDALTTEDGGVSG